MPPTLAAARNTACGRAAPSQRSTCACRPGRTPAAVAVRISQSSRCEPPHQRGADHAAMAGDPDPLAGERIDLVAGAALAHAVVHGRLTLSRPLRPRCSTWTRSASTISLHQVVEAGLVAPAEACRAPCRVAEQQVDLGRAEIARVDLAPAPRRCAASMPFSSTPSPLPRDARGRRRRRRARRTRARCGSRRSRARSRPARPAAASATCPRHSRGHGPSRAWRRDCRGRAGPAGRARWPPPPG